MPSVVQSFATSSAAWYRLAFDASVGLRTSIVTGFLAPGSRHAIGHLRPVGSGERLLGGAATVRDRRVRLRVEQRRRRWDQVGRPARRARRTHPSRGRRGRWRRGARCGSRRSPNSGWPGRRLTSAAVSVAPGYRTSRRSRLRAELRGHRRRQTAGSVELARFEVARQIAGVVVEAELDAGEVRQRTLRPARRARQSTASPVTGSGTRSRCPPPRRSAPGSATPRCR